MEEELFKPFALEVAEKLGEVAEQARLYIDQRKRLEERLEALREEREDPEAAITVKR